MANTELLYEICAIIGAALIMLGILSFCQADAFTNRETFTNLGALLAGIVMLVASCNRPLAQ